MYAIEFQTCVKDGMIQIPQFYQDRVKDMVRVIVLVDAPASIETFIDQLLVQLLQFPDFESLRRDESMRAANLTDRCFVNTNI